MPYCSLPGTRLWYKDSGGSGTSPVVVMLHAASGNCDSWVCQFPALTQAGYRCIAYDRRGWGRSQPNTTNKQHANVCDDLHALVTHLGIGHFHLVAIAAGAIVALDYALAYPEQVRSLVLACTLGGVEDAAYKAVQQRLWPEAMQTLPVELREIGPTYRGFNPAGVRRWLEIARANHHPGTPDLNQPLRQPINYTRLATLRPPLLMLAGEADLLSPPSLMRLLAEPISDCRLITIPEAGHAVFWEKAEICNRLVLDFIGKY